MIGRFHASLSVGYPAGFTAGYLACVRATGSCASPDSATHPEHTAQRESKSHGRIIA